MSPAAMPSKNLLERALSLVTEVEAGEGVTAALMSINIFLLLAAYYVLKTMREALASDRQVNIAIAVMALLLIPTVKAYGTVARKVARNKLISYVTAFFISNLLVFYICARLGYRFGLPFFIWVGIFNNMVIAQFWAYGNDIYRPDQGKRLFPLIMLGSSLGAIWGPGLGLRLHDRLGTPPLFLVAGGMLGVCIAMTLWIDKRARPAAAQPAQKREVEGPLGREGGFELIWKHRYLLLIAILIVLLNVVNTTGEQIRRISFNHYAAASVVQDNPALQEAGKERQLDAAVEAAKFRLNAHFLFWVNLCSFLIQALLVSRILKFLGVRGSLLLVPLVVLVGYGMMALLPVLWVVQTVKIAENSQDYSLMNTLRAALYLPTTREMKYKAKQAIDTFFVRLGDLVAAGIVFVGAYRLDLTVRGLALLMLAFAGGWAVLAWLIVREHRKMVPEENLRPEPAGAR